MLCAAVAAVLVVIITLLTRTGEPIYGWHSYTLSSLIFLCAIAASSSLKWNAAISKAVAWWAGWSYSLYLLHHTILMEFATIRGGGGPNMCIASVLSIAVSIGFAAFTEKHHKVLARAIKESIRRRSLRNT